MSLFTIEKLQEVLADPVPEPILEPDDENEEVSDEAQLSANLTALEDAWRERVPLYRSSVQFMTGGLAVTISVPVAAEGLVHEDCIWIHRTGISSFPDDRDVGDSYSFCYGEAFEHASRAFGLDCLDEEEMELAGDDDEGDEEE